MNGKYFFKVKMLLLLIFCTNRLQGQTLLPSDIPFLDEDGLALPLSAVGGLNAPQFNSVDLNNDAQKDLLLFDKEGSVIIPLLASGNTWLYAPEFIAQFSVVENWMLLKDLNCDGVEELLTQVTDDQTGLTRVEIYQGGHTGGKINFTLQKPVLLFQKWGNTLTEKLTFGNKELPVFEDVDFDGDIDVLSFGSSSSYLQYYQNQSVEQGFGCDSFLLKKVDDCWGRFQELGIAGALAFSPNYDSCAAKSGWQSIRHTVHGSQALLAMDVNNDNAMDLLLSELGRADIRVLLNTGNKDSALISQALNQLPGNLERVNMASFPAAYFIDVDFDALKDLVVAPRTRGSSQNRQLNFYKNIGTNQVPSFSLKSTTFLVDQMVDEGQLSAPATGDLNGDGYADLIIGSGVKRANNQETFGRLTYYEHTGGGQTPGFAHKQEDFAGLEALEQDFLAPTLGDLDADGDKDLLVGLASGELLYLENKGSPSQPIFNSYTYVFSGIDVGQYATPVLFDIDSDSDLDLIIGEKNGNLNLFINSGTPNTPQFSTTPEDNFWGSVAIKSPSTLSGYSAPALVRLQNNDLVLLVGGVDGVQRSFLVTNQAVFSLYNWVEGPLANATLTHPALFDLSNNGKIDLVVGNSRGGIQFFALDMPFKHTLVQNVKKNRDIEFTQNKEGLHFKFNNVLKSRVIYQIYSVQGVLIKQGNLQNTSINIQSLPPAVYYISILYEGHNQHFKFHKS